MRIADGSGIPLLPGVEERARFEFRKIDDYPKMGTVGLAYDVGYG